MIVRISTEGQFQIPDAEAQRLNELDDEVVAAVEAGDEDHFHEAFEALLALVRAGTPLGGEDLSESEVILPPSDLSFAEAGREFTGEGLIPG